MRDFLSCDWGTSSFRLRLVKADTTVAASVEDKEQGIAPAFHAWKRSGANEQQRFIFYRNILAGYIGILETQMNRSLQDIPLVISGMACSSLGMIMLPYTETPFAADGSGFVVRTFDATDDFKHEMIIISGASSEEDVMRGEETQLAGCDHHQLPEEVFIFPGTHSKHVFVKQGRVTDIKTYMTGEFFDLLSRKSILSASVEEGGTFSNKNCLTVFEAGVERGAGSNLLHSSFVVRTNTLFEKSGPVENYYYLSGLLIGSELNELRSHFNRKITLVVAENMKNYYASAFRVLGLAGDAGPMIQDADTALIRGQQRICKQYIS